MAATRENLILGLVSISDRASQGVYEDKGIPTLEAWCKKTITSPVTIHTRLVADVQFEIEKALRELVDTIGCDLVLTTGGTGPSRRDVTPEATLAVATRVMPGFGEQMRAISGHFVPTAILSRQVAVLRETPDHAALIINLPGQPKAIAETLQGLSDAGVNGIFAAVPYCIDLIGGPYIETDESIVKAFRPKSARRARIQTPDTPLNPGFKWVKTTPFDPKDILMVTPRHASASPELCLLWLHGMGVSNQDFAPFADEILEFNGPVCRLVLPNAPMRELTAHPGYPLRAWYDIGADDIDKNEDERGILETASRINMLIDQLESSGIARERIVLGGFSQGAATALYTGLRLQKPIAGIIALSGYLPLAGRLFSEASDTGRKIPVFMGHGAFDSVVSTVIAQRGADVIKTVSSHLLWHEYDMDHEVCAEELIDISSFLRTILAQ